MSKTITYILIAITLICLLFGCAVAKDNRAVNRVLTKPELADKVYRWLERLHPCVTESGHIILGEDKVLHDTTYDSETVDFLNGQIDSLLKSKCKNSTPINLDSLRQQIIKEVKRTIKPEYHLRVDTIPKEDIRRINLYIKDLSEAKGQIAQLNLDNSRERKRGNTLLWWLFGLAGLEVARIIIKYTKKIAWL